MKTISNAPAILTVIFLFVTSFAFSSSIEKMTDDPIQIKDEITIDLDETHKITTFKLLTAEKEMLYQVDYDNGDSELTMDLSNIPNGEYYISVEIEAGLEIFTNILKI